MKLSQPKLTTSCFSQIRFSSEMNTCRVISQLTTLRISLLVQSMNRGGKRRRRDGGRPCCLAPIGCPSLQTPVPPVLLLQATKLQFLSDISPPLPHPLSFPFLSHSCMPSFSALKRRSRT